MNGAFRRRPSGSPSLFFARRTLDPEHAFDLMAETFADIFAQLHELDALEDDEAQELVT